MSTVLFALISSESLQAASVDFASAVKANYVFKFAPFVTWPARAFAASNNKFIICTVGDDSFRHVLDDVVQRQLIQDRAVIIEPLPALDHVGRCHILYTGTSRWTPELTAAVKGVPILTIADETASNSAIIQFVMVDGRVRFKIDAAAAAENDVMLSSKLLTLATAVRRVGE